MSKQQTGKPFSVTATHATAAVATKAAVANKRHIITKITVSSDKANSICLVKQGTTTIWQFQLLQTAAGKSVHSESCYLEGAVGALVSVEIDGTSRCDANMEGVTVNAGVDK